VDRRNAAQTLQRLLGLSVAPVAIAFRAEAPASIPRISSPGPAGCSYWSLAAQGQEFFTKTDDHYGCPLGMHTHNIAMPEASKMELEGLVDTMVQIGYLKKEEIPSIPRRNAPFGVSVYAPLEAATFEPDLVLVRGNAWQMMLLAEASQSAGVAAVGAARGRPTCAVLAEALATGRTAESFGCIGNRVYAGLRDDEAYLAIPGPHLAALVEALATIVAANEKLRVFYESRARR
jgi:uncharacterized protein (DUF169 family)